MAKTVEPFAGEHVQEGDGNEEPFQIPFFLRTFYEGGLGDHYDEVLFTQTKTFEIAIYIELFLFSFVVLYAILHLLYRKRLNDKSKKSEYTRDKEEGSKDKTEPVSTKPMDTMEGNDVDTEDNFPSTSTFPSTSS